MDTQPQTMSSTFKMSVFIAVLCLSFQFGYNIAAPNSAKKNFNKYYFEGSGDAEDDLEKGYYTYWSNLVVAPMPLGALIGSLFNGSLASKYGPKGCMLYVNLVSLLSALFYMLSYYNTPSPQHIVNFADGYDVKELDNGVFYDYSHNRTYVYNHMTANQGFPVSLVLLVIARFLIGGFVGLASGISPRYIMEIAHKNDRGKIGVLNQLFITVGILAAQTAGLESVFGNSWIKVFVFPCLFSILCLVGLAKMPESPRYLMIVKNDKQSALAALTKFRSDGEVSAEQQTAISEEMDEMIKEKGVETQVEYGPLALIKAKKYRWQVISLIAMHVCQQLSGINAVFFYSDEVLKTLSIENTEPYTMGLGAINVFMTVVSALIIERTGRKRLLSSGYAMMVFWMILIIILLNKTWDLTSSVGLPYTAISGYIVGFAVGPGPIPWIYNTEFFDQSTRGSAGIIGCVANWSSGYILSIFFRPLQQQMGVGIFIPFIIVSLISLVWLFRFIPETKEKSFDDIFNDFASLNRVSKKEEDGEEKENLKDSSKI